MKLLRVLLVLTLSLLWVSCAARQRLPDWHPQDAMGKELELLRSSYEDQATACGKYFLAKEDTIVWSQPVSFGDRHKDAAVMNGTKRDNVLVHVQQRVKPVIRFQMGEKNISFFMSQSDYDEAARCLPTPTVPVRTDSTRFRLQPMAPDSDEPCGEYFHVHGQRLHFTGVFPFGFGILRSSTTVHIDEGLKFPMAEMPNRHTAVIYLNLTDLRNASCLPQVEQ